MKLYLAAFAFVASTLVGALTLAFIGRLTGARWYRDAAAGPAEALVATIPALFILFLPIAFGIDELYPWAREEMGDRGAYLEPAAFLARSLSYLAIWSALGLALPRRPIGTSAAGLILVGFTSSFAAFDWTMSLDPEWASAVYGVYVWSGGFLAAVALVLLMGGTSSSTGDQTPSETLRLAVEGAGRPGRAALAKLMLTGAIFWAYIAYAQGFIPWIGGLPRELAWFDDRLQGPWATVLVLAVLGKFLVPVLALLSYETKRMPGVQLAVSGTVLVGHALDCLWLVRP